MRLRLRKLPARILGIYGAGKDELPERMRYLEPEAAESYLALEGSPRRLRVSDMLRSAESSLLACQQKRGVQPPAFSGHNYGLSIDVHVADCLRRFRMDKRTLDGFLAAAGWHCHRKDHALGAESWHFNYLGRGAEAHRYLAASAKASTTLAALEAKIQDRYGAAMKLSAVAIQTALQRLSMYSGALDGDLGALSKQAIQVFQRAWQLDPSGKPDARTQRTLAFVAADLELV
jgi:hypothetical protein